MQSLGINRWGARFFGKILHMLINYFRGHRDNVLPFPVSTVRKVKQSRRVLDQPQRLKCANNIFSLDRSHCGDILDGQVPAMLLQNVQQHLTSEAFSMTKRIPLSSNCEKTTSPNQTKVFQECQLSPLSLKVHMLG